MAAQLDPGAEATMRLASAVLAADDRIKAQQRTIWALVTCLRAERAASAALTDLLDSLLTDLDRGG